MKTASETARYQRLDDIEVDDTLRTASTKGWKNAGGATQSFKDVETGDIFNVLPEQSGTWRVRGQSYTISGFSTETAIEAIDEYRKFLKY